MYLLLTVTRDLDLGYTLAGAFLGGTGIVLWMFAAASKLHRVEPRPDPVHPDDWAPDAPLWNEGDHDA